MSDSQCRKKLIEVALPLEAINLAGRAEKAVPKKGHPATMHPWWSRKPIGIARAVIFASLVDDPCSEGDTGPESLARRERLLELTALLAHWDADQDTDLMSEVGRAIDECWPNGRPGALDPFCGGGAIPLEASRLGLFTTAIDLNPVAALITRVMIEILPRHGDCGPLHPRHCETRSPNRRTGLALDVQAYGDDLEKLARGRLDGRFDRMASPFSPDGMTTAVSYLWSRTVNCPNPTCGRSTPMLSTWWLSKKAKNRWHVRPVLDGSRVEFEVHQGEPPPGLTDPKVGRGANYRCVWCEEAIEPTHVRSEGKALRLGLRLAAIQAFKNPSSGRKGRIWLSPIDEVERAGLREPCAELDGLDVEVPTTSGNAHTYGITRFTQLLSPRQLETMCAFSDELKGMRDQIERDASAAGLATRDTLGGSDGPSADSYADAVVTCLAIAVSRMANRVSTMTVHNRANGSVEQSFIQPAFGFYGEFPEANPFSGSTGSWQGSLNYVVPSIEALSRHVQQSSVTLGSALEADLPGDVLVSTDPPYYDMFDYADLSNLYYVWLRRILREIWPDLMATIRVSGDSQIDANASREGRGHKEAHKRFESMLSTALTRIREVQHEASPVTIYYGYQQSQTLEKDGSTAWEAFLESLRAAGLAVVATWPLRTERPEGVKKRTNSLASSILLACRPHDSSGPIGDQSDLRRALAADLPRQLSTLHGAGIPAVDMGQAAIGLGMATYSGFGRVVGTDGRDLPITDVLAVIREVLTEATEGFESTVSAHSQWAIGWLESNGYDEGPYGVAEQLTKTWNTTTGTLEDAGIIEAEQGRVRLRQRVEYRDEALTRTHGGWAAAQLLAGALESDGELAAASVLSVLDHDVAEEALAVAHRHFAISEGRGDGADAVAFNALTIAWPAIVSAAATMSARQGELL